MIRDNYLIIELYLPINTTLLNMLKIIIKSVILLLLLTSCINADKPAKEKVKPKININTKEIKKEPVKNNIFKKKESDSIDTKNVVEFLTKYGNLNKESLVLIKTRLGNIKIKLYEDTPLYRANFIFLSKIGYFDSTCFYRVVPDFIIQGGNSERIKTMRYRNKYRNYKIPSDFNSSHKHNTAQWLQLGIGKIIHIKNQTPLNFILFKVEMAGII